MGLPELFLNCNNQDAVSKAEHWYDFLVKNKFDFTRIKSIDFKSSCPVITDHDNNKFSIDFVNDKTNYSKKKGGLKSETIARAMGSGRHGMRVLDLSAGLCIDAVFLSQLGFEVTAVERNPLIYLCLKNAIESYEVKSLKVEFGEAVNFLNNTDELFDIVYFDPMFPEKSKSALPRQEMVFFKKLVGNDEDALVVLKAALGLKGIKRVAVKRPLKAPDLGLNPVASIDGKLIRFDVYGVQKS